MRWRLARTELAPGRFALRFGTQMISLHPADKLPAIAAGTARGSGNFCLLTDVPMAEITAHLAACGVATVAGPDERIGAGGRLHSVYFNDPDGNLVEVSNPIAD